MLHRVYIIISHYTISSYTHGPSGYLERNVCSPITLRPRHNGWVHNVNILETITTIVTVASVVGGVAAVPGHIGSQASPDNDNPA
jgi:hypothetical protein